LVENVFAGLAYFHGDFVLGICMFGFVFLQVLDEDDDYHSATAQTVQDAQKLIEAGFEYVCEFSDVKIFRRRK